jgi:hypothetical protein
MVLLLVRGVVVVVVGGGSLSLRGSTLIFLTMSAFYITSK